MRVDVNKFLCLGANSQRDQFFAHSQKLGVVEFIDSNAQNSSEWPSELQEMQVSYKMIHSNEKITQKPLGDNWTPGLLTEHILTSKKDVYLALKHAEKKTNKIISSAGSSK